MSTFERFDKLPRFLWVMWWLLFFIQTVCGIGIFVYCPLWMKILFSIQFVLVIGAAFFGVRLFLRYRATIEWAKSVEKMTETEISESQKEIDTLKRYSVLVLKRFQQLQFGYICFAEAVWRVYHQNRYKDGDIDLIDAVIDQVIQETDKSHNIN